MDDIIKKIADIKEKNDDIIDEKIDDINENEDDFIEKKRLICSKNITVHTKTYDKSLIMPL